MRVSRTLCVWLNVSTTPGKGAYMYRSGYLQGAGVISTSDTKLGELFLKQMLKVSMHSVSVTSFGMTFHRRVPSGKIPRWYAKVGAYGTRNWALPFLLLAGACMMWSNARMSTRP